MTRQKRLAIAGNPNCGKTALFNTLTGANQRVGNWPGVTVERIEGEFYHDNTNYNLVDLPGVYSLSGSSVDEQVTCTFLKENKVDLIINIVDASNLYRNLFLTTQLVEAGVPTVLALNMMDVAGKCGIIIDCTELSEMLGCIVVPMSVVLKQGVTELKDAIANAIAKGVVPHTCPLPAELDNVIAEFENCGDPRARWHAIRAIEDPYYTIPAKYAPLKKTLVIKRKELTELLKTEIEESITTARYDFISSISKSIIKSDDNNKRGFTELFDSLLMNRFLGLPLFLLVMYLVFTLTLSIGGSFIGFAGQIADTIFVGGLRELLTGFGMGELLISFFADGIGGGIQTVATFIPPIFMLFIALSFLEDSGYMVRAAVVLDRLFRMFGMSGKAFIPMMVGFGCNVPGVMSTRILENREERIVSVLINPFMSCGGRLPILSLFISTFFVKHGPLVMFGMYLLGIVAAVITGFMLRKTLLKGEAVEFMMELPKYHMPSVFSVLLRSWQRIRDFVFNAGKIVLVMVILLKALSFIGTDGSIVPDNSDKSVLSCVGKTITPAFRPMGIFDDNWPATVGLFTGIFAKEVVVSTLNSLYADIDRKNLAVMIPADQQIQVSQYLMGGMSFLGKDAQADNKFDFWGGIAGAFASVPGALKSSLTNLDPTGIFGTASEVNRKTPSFELLDQNSIELNSFVKRFGSSAAALSYLIFIMLYVPCVATVAAIYREAGKAWGTFSIFYQTIFAWLVATLVFQIGNISNAPEQSILWISLCVIIFISIYLGLHFMAVKSSRTIREEEFSIDEEPEMNA